MATEVGRVGKRRERNELEVKTTRAVKAQRMVSREAPVHAQRAQERMYN